MFVEFLILLFTLTMVVTGLRYLIEVLSTVNSDPNISCSITITEMCTGVGFGFWFLSSFPSFHLWGPGSNPTGGTLCIGFSDCIGFSWNNSLRFPLKSKTKTSLFLSPCGFCQFSG